MSWGAAIGAVVLFYVGGAIGWAMGARAREASYRNDVEVLRAALTIVERDPGASTLYSETRFSIRGALAETAGRWEVVTDE